MSDEKYSEEKLNRLAEIIRAAHTPDPPVEPPVETKPIDVEARIGEIKIGWNWKTKEKALQALARELAVERDALATDFTRANDHALATAIQLDEARDEIGYLKYDNERWQKRCREAEVARDE